MTAPDQPLALTDAEITLLIAAGLEPEDLHDQRRHITRNAVKCLSCQEVIESASRHDMTWCSCRSVAVDGGRSYLRRVHHESARWEDLSEHADLDDAEWRAAIDTILSTCRHAATTERPPDEIAAFRAALAAEEDQ